jgi:hypothetical protein
MTPSIKRLGRWALLVVMVLVVASIIPWGYMAGNVRARIDLAHGNSKILVWGLPTPWREQAAMILHDRYQIEIKPVAGCTASLFTRNYARGYNSVSEPAISAKFGRDVLKESFDAAEVNWERAHPHN